MSEREIITEIPDHIWQVFEFLANPKSMYRYIPREWYEPIVTVKREKLWAHPDSRVDSFCKLECGEGMYIGKYVHIASFTHLGIGGGLLILEQGSSCASGVKIITGSNQPGEGHGCSAIDPKAIIKRSFVHVKRNATLYTGVIVCPGVTIGEGAVVLPGAVVTKDVQDGETWGGVPAKKITKSSDRSPFQVEIEEHLMKEFGKLPRFTEKLMQSEKMELTSNTISIDGDIVSRESFDKVYKKEFFGSDPGRSFAVDLQDPRKCNPSCGCDVEAEKTCPACSTRIDLGSMQCGYCGKMVTLEVSAKDQSTKSIGEQSLDMWTAAQAEMYCWDDDDKNIG